MDITRRAPKLWIVTNDIGEEIIFTEDEQEAAWLYFECKRQNRKPTVETQQKRMDGLRKANLVRQRHVMSQIVPR